MSDAEIEVETASYNILPKEVTNEIGTVKLLYGPLSLSELHLFRLSLTPRLEPLARNEEPLHELLADRLFS
jgi:hypothetical protein